MDKEPEDKKRRKTGLIFLYLFFILAIFIWLILVGKLMNTTGTETDTANQLAPVIFAISLLILAIGFMIRHYYEKRLGLKISEIKKLFKYEKKLENSEQISEEEKKFIEENKGQLEKWSFTKKNLRNIRGAFIIAVIICLLGVSITVINYAVVNDDITNGSKKSNNSDDKVTPDNKPCPSITIEYCYKKSPSNTSSSALCWVSTGKSSNWDLNGTSMYSSGEGDGLIPRRCIPSGTEWK